MARRDSGELTRGVKRVARRFGAALVGVAPVARFDPMPPLNDAPPPGHHPRDFLPEARSVISIAQPILGPVLDAPAILAERDLPMIPPHVRYPYMEMFYNRVGHALQDVMLEFIAQAVGQFLVSRGYQAMIFPTTGQHPRVEGMTEQQIWDGTAGRKGRPHSPFRYTFGPFSHRHAATRAGLGEFGYSNVVLTRQFGPRQRFNSIVTDAPLRPDPLIARPICLRDRCRLCLKACSMRCIRLRTDPDLADYRRIRRDQPGRIFIDTPSATDPQACMSRRDGRPDAPVRGDCIRVCPIPRLPRHMHPRLAALVRKEFRRQGKGAHIP